MSRFRVNYNYIPMRNCKETKKVISGSFVGDTPPGTSSYLSSRRSGDISLAIAPGRRWRQCPLNECREKFTYYYEINIVLEGHSSAHIPLGPVVDCCVPCTWPVGSSRPTSHDLCG